MVNLKILIKRVLITCLGFVIMGFSIAVLRVIGLGVDPFSAMNLGISTLTDVSFGTLMAVSQLPLFLIILWKRRNLIYMIANIGMVPYDAFVLVIEALTGGKMKFKWARLSMDGVCAVTASLLGSTIGIATAMTVFCMGPFISFFRNKIGAYADKQIFV